MLWFLSRVYGWVSSGVSRAPESIHGIRVDVYFLSKRGSMFFQILKGAHDLKKSKNPWFWSKCVSWDLFNTLLLETNQGPAEGCLWKRRLCCQLDMTFLPSLCSSKFLFVLPIISIKGYFQGWLETESGPASAAPGKYVCRKKPGL